jgi:hypothetical protein
LKRVAHCTAESGSGHLVEEEINGGNPTVPGDNEVRTGDYRGFARSALQPLDSTTITNFFGPGNHLISKVRVLNPKRTGYPIDLVAASVNILVGFIENDIFGEDLVDGRAATRRIVFTEDVMKIAG